MIERIIPHRADKVDWLKELTLNNRYATGTLLESLKILMDYRSIGDVLTDRRGYPFKFIFNGLGSPRVTQYTTRMLLAKNNTNILAELTVQDYVEIGTISAKLTLLDLTDAKVRDLNLILKLCDLNNVSVKYIPATMIEINVEGLNGFKQLINICDSICESYRRGVPTSTEVYKSARQSR